MQNVFDQWNEREMEMHPFREDRLEHSLLRRAESFGTFGRVVELYLPNAFQAAIGIISSEVAPPGSFSDGRPLPPCEWKTRMNLPEPPREGTLGRFRPTEGR